jgi:hypothetical protein
MEFGKGCHETSGLGHATLKRWVGGWGGGGILPPSGP